ncbi:MULTISPECIES: SIS domain-containing protein [Lactobacillus]|uniref:SIS domain-containing protein n=1 Tax=Lactobacillus TaxID=1578 RepID=UPI0018DBE9BD|nr:MULTISPECIES: SIS domain-containing protein [Lactobacillus]MBI0022333.1 SIS domain-containing protein [Lactobacillus sp. W8172]
MYFDKNEFLTNYNSAVKELDHVDEVLAKLRKKDIKNIFFTGCGGSYTKFVNLRPLMFKKLSIPFVVTTPEELCDLYHDDITNDSLILAGTKTGETTELVEAIEKIRKDFPKSTIISFIGDENSTLEKESLIDERIKSFDTDANLIELGWFLIHFAQETDNKTKESQKQQLKEMAQNVAEGIEALVPAALDHVNNTDIDQMQMWVGSGNVWGEVCCFANYLMEEIQHIKAQAINSGEFFHGPFEIIDNNQSVSVVVNSNSNRQEDMRVVNFVKQFAKNPLIIDMKAFKLNEFDSDLQVFIEAYALNHYFDTLFNMYSIKTGRSAKTRRYYRLLEY